MQALRHRIWRPKLRFASLQMMVFPCSMSNICQSDIRVISVKHNNEYDFSSISRIFPFPLFPISPLLFLLVQLPAIRCSILCHGQHRPTFHYPVCVCDAFVPGDQLVTSPFDWSLVNSFIRLSTCYIHDTFFCLSIYLWTLLKTSILPYQEADFFSNFLPPKMERKEQKRKEKE